MMKHKNMLLVVVTIAIMFMGSCLFTTITEVNAASNIPKNCKDKDALSAYYNINFEWKDDLSGIVFTTKKGEFKLLSISDNSFVTNVSTKDKDGFLLVDGKDSTVNSEKSLTLKVNKVGTSTKDFSVKFALSKSDSICDSYTEYNEKKKKNEDTYTYETNDITIHVPNYSAIGAQLTEDNKNYNGVCLAVRNGTDPTGKINKDILKMFDSSSKATEHYKSIVPTCFSTKVAINYSASDMASIVESALNSWDILKSASKTDSDGTDSWSIKFNDVMNKAKDKNYSYDGKVHSYYADENTGEGSNFYSDKTKSKLVAAKGTGEFKMWCKTTANSSTDFSNLLQYSSDGKYNINANIQNYYAYNEVVGTAIYTWNYTEGNNLKQSEKTQKVDVCTRKCEEAVEVKYGPPVASKAGLCFEYQVQVTSRVRCISIVTAKPPKEPAVCQPIPICNGIPGHVHQAGPVDDYESCINSCDGGKYTKECSDKCFDKVYGDSSDLQATALDYATASIERVVNRPFSFEGKYLWSNGNIVWSRNNTYAIYYKLFEYARTQGDHGYGKYLPVNGFKKRHNGGESFCTDPCKFTSCSQNSYLNQDEAKADYQANVKLYNQAIAKCKASASCTTKQATFTINVSYKDGSGDIKTIDYPYESNPQPLDSDGNKESVACSANGTYDSNKSIILNYGGCYKKCGDGTEYHSRWSFPGVWLNNKTGELAFKKPSGDTWKEQDNKFCLPLDAKNVNQKWWNYYYGLYDSKNETSVDSSEYHSKCPDPSSIGFSDSSYIEKWSIDDEQRWNINAEAKKFGYFGWNFDMQCFYAINSKSAVISGNNSSETAVSKCVPDPDDGKENYRVRTVDLQNLFPASDGSSLSDPTETGRAPGFNWSSYADNDKNVSYISKPSLYTQAVQALGYGVYSNNYLDYEFNISREVIAGLKSKSRNYTDFKGSMKDYNGIYSYRSTLIRDGVLSSNSKVPSEKTIGCNNIDNWQSTSCAGY